MIMLYEPHLRTRVRIGVDFFVGRQCSFFALSNSCGLYGLEGTGTVYLLGIQGPCREESIRYRKLGV